MPRAALLFLVGSVAICGIPPLNGFVSEFLLYLGFFSQLQATSLVYLVLLAPLLALVGGLASIAFTKLYSSVFLGTPRSSGAAHPHEAGLTMLLPMALFALLCLLIGLAATAGAASGLTRDCGIYAADGVGGRSGGVWRHAGSDSRWLGLCCCW